MLPVMKSVRGRSRKYIQIPIGCALLFRLLKCCFPESSSCVTFPLPFFFSWPLWNKWSQGRNGHFPHLSEVTYIASGTRRKKMSSLFPQVSKMEWSYAFTDSLSKALSFSSAEPWGGRGSGQVWYLPYIALRKVFLQPSLSLQTEKMEEDPSSAF